MNTISGVSKAPGQNPSSTPPPPPEKEAQFEKALFFQRTEEHQNAFDTFKKLADEGYTQAMLPVALYFLNLKGDGVITKNLEQAIKYLEQAVAADSNDYNARNQLGICLFSKKEYQAAFKQFEEADILWCKKTDRACYPEAAYYLGKISEQENSPVGREKAFTYYKLSAEAGDERAMYEVAQIYNSCHSTQGHFTHLKEAVFWYQKAADNMHKEAMSKLESLFFQQQCGHEIEGKGKDIQAKLNIAEMYEAGIEVVKNLKKAAEWYEHIAPFSSLARLKLGMMYKDGTDVKKNIGTAINFLTFDTPEEDPNYWTIQFMLGCCYWEACGYESSSDSEFQLTARTYLMKFFNHYETRVLKIDEKAQGTLTADKRLVTLSATEKTNLALASYYLGLSYFGNDTTEENRKSYSLSLFYFEVASDLGNKNAGEKLGELYEILGYKSYIKSIEARAKPRKVVKDLLGVEYSKQYKLPGESMPGVTKALEYYIEAEKRGNPNVVDTIDLIFLNNLGEKFKYGYRLEKLKSAFELIKTQMAGKHGIAELEAEIKELKELAEPGKSEELNRSEFKLQKRMKDAINPEKINSAIQLRQTKLQVEKTKTFAKQVEKLELKFQNLTKDLERTNFMNISAREKTSATVVTDEF